MLKLQSSNHYDTTSLTALISAEVSRRPPVLMIQNRTPRATVWRGRTSKRLCPQEWMSTIVKGVCYLSRQQAPDKTRSSAPSCLPLSNFQHDCLPFCLPPLDDVAGRAWPDVSPSVLDFLPSRTVRQKSLFLITYSVSGNLLRQHKMD